MCGEKVDYFRVRVAGDRVELDEFRQSFFDSHKIILLLSGAERLPHKRRCRKFLISPGIEWKREEVEFGDQLAGIKYRDRPAAYAVIKNIDGRIAAVRGTRGYFLPGSGSLPDEQPEATIKREILEELARDARLLPILFS